MFRQLRVAISRVSDISSTLSSLLEVAQDLLSQLQQPSALLPMQERLDGMEASLNEILGQAESILLTATRERKEARNAEERMRTREKRVDEATEALDSYRESPEDEQPYVDPVPNGDGDGSEAQPMHPLRSRLAARAEAKARARAHKYSV